MNVAQELSDRELYDYDVLIKLLGDRFDPASRVSASRSRFHGRTRRHQEDADTYADSITELCRLGYPQSSPELCQELISEQFVRGQSDPELKKYLWVVIRTQKERKLQTLIEVCTDFAAEQVFALEEDDDRLGSHAYRWRAIFFHYFREVCQGSVSSYIFVSPLYPSRIL